MMRIAPRTMAHLFDGREQTDANIFNVYDCLSSRVDGIVVEEGL